MAYRRDPAAPRRAMLTGMIALAMLASCDRGAATGPVEPEATVGPVGLFTSLPLYWGETPEVRDILETDEADHWVLAVLGGRNAVTPLDSLASADGALPLPLERVLVLAQPYPLSPQENVALDDWVRAGGRLLLFADPMLTAESAYALGDRRRPQDIALLSPILKRWGLDLQFDDKQPLGQRDIKVAGGTVRVNLPGRFALTPGPEYCTLEGRGLIAICAIGEGKVVAVADAALLESASNDDVDSRRAMLSRLLDKLAG